ncbi:MAG: 3-oxoacid CoA-transferase subunit B [Trueperaceae bacterium]
MRGVVVQVQEQMARRAARLLSFGEVVALGIGLPTQVAEYVTDDQRVTFFAENGVAGIGPRPRADREDADVINAGGQPVTLLSHGSYFDSATAFAAIRGGRLTTAVLGALQVSEQGDLASWKIPGRFSPGMGGSMELAGKARRTIVLTRHETRDGQPKLLPSCTIPLTAARAVDIVITDLGMFAVTDDGLLLQEVVPGLTADEVLRRTPCRVRVADPLGSMAPTTAQASEGAGGEDR